MNLTLTFFQTEFTVNYFFLTVIDVFMMFFLTHLLLRQKISDTLGFSKGRKGNWPQILLIVATGLAVIVLTGVFGLYMLRIFSFFFIKLLSKSAVDTDLLVYASFLILLILNELFATKLMFILRHFNHDFYYRDLMIFLGLGALIAVCVAYKYRIGYKAFNQLDKNPITKITIFLLCYLVLTGFFFIRYFLQWEYNPFYVSYILFTGALIVIVSMSYMKALNQRFRELSMQNHDLKKAMRGVLNASRSGDDVDLEQELADARYVVGIKDTPFEEPVADIEENFKQLVEIKKTRNGRNVEIISQIKYYEKHAHVGLTGITVMFELMLDNAIEEADNHPVYAKISVAEESLDIIVRNECSEYKFKDFMHYLEKGGSGKNGQSRGVGLQKLKGLVQRFNGEIIPRHYFCDENQTYYLSVMVRVKG